MTRPGVQVQELIVGSGDMAVRGKTVVVNARLFLSDGTELTEDMLPATPWRIDLRKRYCIAGIRYGIEGMRVGGERMLTIDPHLAYGRDGVPGKVPPNAILRCEIELLEVREPGVVKPEDYPPGRHLIVGWLGDLQRGVPKWQFGLHEGGRCGLMVSIPIPGLKWRHARPKNVEQPMVAERADSLIQAMIDLPDRYRGECLIPDQVCVDHSGHDGGVHRSRETGSLCVAVTVWERGQVTDSYYLAETAQAWRESEIRGVVDGLLASVTRASRTTA